MPVVDFLFSSRSSLLYTWYVVRSAVVSGTKRQYIFCAGYLPNCSSSVDILLRKVGRYTGRRRVACLVSEAAKI